MSVTVQRSVVEAFPTTKVAAAEVECGCWLRYWVGIKQTGWFIFRNSFVWENVFFASLSAASPVSAAVIGCRHIQLRRPEAFWSVPVGDGNLKWTERSQTNCSLQFIWDFSFHFIFLYVISWHRQTNCKLQFVPAYYNADILLKNIVFNAHPEGIKLNWDFPNSLTWDQKAKQEVCRIFVFETHHNQRGKVVTSEQVLRNTDKWRQ